MKRVYGIVEKGSELVLELVQRSSFDFAKGRISRAQFNKIMKLADYLEGIIEEIEENARIEEGG